MNEDLDIAAAEYVLGTLPASERAQFTEQLLKNGDLRRAVRSWEARFAPLATTSLEEVPPPGLWRRVEGLVAQQSPAIHTSVLPLGAARLKRRIVVWRGAAAAAAAVAAASLVWIFTGHALAPGSAGTQYVAVVAAGGAEPALIAEVDTAKGIIRVRSLQAETPAGHSLELWHIPNGEAPRSLGILKAGATSRNMRDQISTVAVDGQIAVSVEPEGGSPSGAPTGPVVYSGRLVPMSD